MPNIVANSWLDILRSSSVMVADFIEEPLVVGGRETYKVRCVDKSVNQVTDKETESAIDLDGYDTVQLMVAFDAGSGYGAWTEKTMTKDPDQANNTGYATYQWASDDLTAGTMKLRVKLTESGGEIYYSDLFYEDVEAA